MADQDVVQRLRASFDTLPPKLKIAARFLIDSPTEVALLSMREQARKANVQPATMTRLAQWLGFSGFDELRSHFANALRSDSGSFSSRSVKLLERRQTIGDVGLINDYVDTIASYIEHLKSPAVVEAMVAATACLRSASTIYTAGVRSAFPVAFQIAYVAGYFAENVVLLDGAGNTGADVFRRAGDQDVLLVTSVEPYANSIVSLAQDAKARGIRIVAITDSTISPVARIATVVITIQKLSPSFFDTMAPAFVTGEILVALLAAHAGLPGTARIEANEESLRAAGVFFKEPSTVKKRQ